MPVTMFKSSYVGAGKSFLDSAPAKLAGDFHPACFLGSAPVGLHLLPWKFSLSCPRGMLRNILPAVPTGVLGSRSRCWDTHCLLAPLRPSSQQP